MRSGYVNQIPVIDKPSISQIQVINLCPVSLIIFGITMNKNQEGKKSVLMVAGAEQFFGLSESKALMFLSQFPDYGDANTTKQVAVAILSGTRFEEFLERDCRSRIS
jgi:hypothetical protein